MIIINSLFVYLIVWVGLTQVGLTTDTNSVNKAKHQTLTKNQHNQQNDNNNKNTSSEYILQLDAATMQQAKKQYQFLIVYFYDQQCQYCNTTNQVYHTIHSLASKSHAQHNTRILAQTNNKIDTIEQSQSKQQLQEEEQEQAQVGNDEQSTYVQQQQYWQKNTQKQQDAQSQSQSQSYSQNVKNTKNTPSDNYKQLYIINKMIQFAQIQYSKNKQVFQKLKLQSVPQLILFCRKQNKHYLLPLAQLSYTNVQYVLVWIKRVTQKFILSFSIIQQYLSLQEFKNQKSVIFDCGSTQLIKKITQSQNFMIFLDLTYVCIKNSNLKNNKILLSSPQHKSYISSCLQQNHDKQKQQKTGDSTTTTKYNEQWQKCQMKINNFRYKGLVHWSPQILHQLYHYNRTAVAVVTSNSTVCQQMIRQLIRIKEQLQQADNEDNNLPIFVVADVHWDIQQAMRLRMFLGGFQLEGWPYPYPMLSYLWVDHKGNLAKYIYQKKYEKSEKSQFSIEQWIKRAMSHKQQRYYRSQDAVIAPNLIEPGQDRTIYKLYLSQYNILINRINQKAKNNKQKKQKKPALFVYIFWKSSWQMQLISSKIKKWWSKSHHQAMFINFDLYDNELPQSVQVKLLPALIVYYDDGTISVKQGILSQKQAISFVSNSFKSY